MRKPPKRIRKAHPLLPRSRVPPARKHRISPDPSRLYVVELHIAKDRRHMRSLAHMAHDPLEPECMGLVRHYLTKTNRRRVCIAGGVVARMYLNRKDLRARPGDIVAHECTHAGMAWAKFRGEGLRNMRSEEVLCYATGRMVAQVNRICYAEGVWK